jgi:hypothetical protein
MVASRAQYEEEARQFLNERAGNMSAEEGVQLGRLFNTGMWGGVLRIQRFAPAFHGATIKRLVDDLDLFNHWTRILWSPSEEEALDGLDRICKEQSTLPGAGRSYPSMLLYLRDPNRYAVWMKSTAKGLVALVDHQGPGRAGGRAAYETFSKRVGELREEFGLAPQEPDAILSAAFREFGKKKKVALPPKPQPKPPGESPVPLNDVAVQTSIPIDDLETWVELLSGPKQQALFYGPPGTGKTFVAERIGLHVAGDEARVTTVQFHPSFSYEDFIEGLRPVTSQSGSMSYEIRPGIFVDFCETASLSPEHRFVFIIDEINRADLGSVLGELMLLLEYRGKKTLLPYSKNEFSVPDNVILLASMNTADRSLAMVDYALRRRFHAIELLPNRDVLEAAYGAAEGAETALQMFDLVQSRVADKNFAPGHSYWLMNDPSDEALLRVWNYELKPYLSEFWFEHPTQLDNLEKEISELLSEAVS